MGKGVSDYNLLQIGGSLLGGAFGGPAGAAIGSTLGSVAEGDDFTEAMMGGLMSFGIGSAFQGIGDVASAGLTTDAAETAIKSAQPVGKELSKKALSQQIGEKVGFSGITDSPFGPLYESSGDNVFNTISSGVGEGKGFATYGDLASTAIKNPKVYTGLGMAGLGLAGQMEPAPIEAPEKRTYSRRPNLTEGPPRARFAPGADYAPGYDPEFDYGFAKGGIVPMDKIADMGLSIKRVGPAPQRRGGGILNMAALAQANPNMFNRITEDEDEGQRLAGGGIVSGNRKYATGNLIDRFVNTNPQNPGEVISNVGTGLSVANTFGNIGAPGLGTAVGALGAGLAANAYQDDLASRGINTDYNAQNASERNNPNFISGPEAMVNSATFGLVGQSPKERYDEIIRRAQAMTTPGVVDDGDISPDLTISPTAPVSSVESSDMAPVDGDDEDDGMEGPTIDLNAISNLPSVETLTDQQKLDAGVVTTPPIVNELAVQNAVANAARDSTPVDTGLTAVMSGEGLSPDEAWSNVSADAFADPGFGEEGMGSSWAQGGLVPGSMNQPQKRYFGIYKKGGPVRSYALGKNVDAIEEEQVQQNPIVVEAVAAITGNHPKPEVAIMQFIKMYGEEAFVALREEVVAEASSEDRQASGLGALSGPGTGLSDDIPAEVKQGGLREPAALSVGEQVVPADVVAMLGDGSTEAGSRKIDNMVDEVRMQKTGTKKQAGPLDMNRVEGMMA